VAQVTTGLKAVLSVPIVYDLFQGMVGAGRFRRRVASEYVCVGSHRRVLDIGCGTGEFIRYLPDDVEYVGFDLSSDYIKVARTKYGNRGKFECADVSTYSAEREGLFDVVLAFGILHHLDDGEARALMQIAWANLAPNGRLITIDPTFVEGQSSIARAIISRDRGRNVRQPPAYLAFAEERFSSARVSVRNDLLLIPYSHCVVEGTR
jgi:SAM-dependent methyltransferase